MPVGNEDRAGGADLAFGAAGGIADSAIWIDNCDLGEGGLSEVGASCDRAHVDLHLCDKEFNS